MIIRPLATTPYVPKLRLLVTDACTHTCPFCHNEGQPRAKRELDLARLAPQLSFLRSRFASVTLSGGEPLQSSQINELIQELDRHAFDITIDTAGTDFHRLSPRSLISIKNIHCSIISLGVDLRLSSCNGQVSQKIEDLVKLRAASPLLGICVNIPFVSPEAQISELESMLGLARRLGADLKFIGELRRRGLQQSAQSSWIDRWGVLAEKLIEFNFHIIGSSPREVDYFSDETGVGVSFADIACASVDPEFSGGRCFTNMDLTIDANAQVKMCRWTAGSIPLEEFTSNSSICLKTTINTDIKECPHGIQPEGMGLVAQLPEQVLTTHGDWPKKDSELHHAVSIELHRTHLRGEFSNFGRDGQTRRFESLLCEYFESSFALTACSGGAALGLAFAACELGPEFEIVVPAISYGGAVAPVLETGASIRFCDVNPQTGRPSVADILAVVGPRTRAILVTHLWGRPVDVLGLRRALGRRDVLIIEDASHAAGGRWQGLRLGTLGDIGCFSLQANKSLFAGEGGFAVTTSRELFERMIVNGMLRKRITDDVRSTRYRQHWLTGLGAKQKLNPLCAAIGIASLSHLDQVVRNRLSAMEILADAVRNSEAYIRLDSHRTDEAPAAYYRPRIAIQSGAQTERDHIVNELISMGAQVSLSELVPLSQAPAFRGRSPDYLKPFDGATRYLESTFGLPNLSIEDFGLVRWYASQLHQAASGGFSHARAFSDKTLPRRSIPITAV